MAMTPAFDVWRATMFEQVGARVLGEQGLLVVFCVAAESWWGVGDSLLSSLR